MSVAALIPWVLKASIALIVFALGLEVSASEVLALRRRPGQLLRSLLAMSVIMPAVAVALAASFDLHPAVKIALVALALSPVPPILPRKQLKAGGSASYVVGLLVATAVLALVFVPLGLAVMGRYFAMPVHLPTWQIAKILLVSVLAPLAVGMLVRHLAAPAAAKIARPVSRAATVLLVLSLVPILITSWPGLVSLVGNGTLAAIAVFVVVGLAAGHLLGGPDSTDRTTLALSTASRHPGIALAIASAAFPTQQLVLPAVLLYLITGAVLSAPYARWRKRASLPRPSKDEPDQDLAADASVTDASSAPATFSLLGGPLHQLGRRMGLVRKNNTVRLGLALGLVSWIVLVVLGVAGGTSRLWSFVALGAHLRPLIVVPLLFLAESWMDPRMNAFVHTMVAGGVVSESARPKLEKVLARVRRWRDGWLLDTTCLAIAALCSVLWPQAQIEGGHAAVELSNSLAGQWCWFVFVPLFRFLLLRWAFRLVLWWLFLWRLSRLDLKLVATHPDGVAGLGELEVVHANLAPLMLAISVTVATSVATELVGHTIAFDHVYPVLVLILVLDAALVLVPSLFFFPKLKECRERGASDYAELGQRYVSAFEQKWLAPGVSGREPLLGNADVQSLADLSNSVAIVSRMRLLPVSTRLLVGLAIPACVPMLSLLLLRYPLVDLTKLLLKRLSGA